MNHQRIAPGLVRDSIVRYLTAAESASLAEIYAAVAAHIGDVSASSIRSYLNIKTPELFERTAPGRYRLRKNREVGVDGALPKPTHVVDHAKLYHASCFDWMRAIEPHSIQAIVTDPPYGLLEYTEIEQAKLRKGRGGVWRIPPSFDGHRRAPLPRFTVLNDGDRAALNDFFFEFGQLALRVTVPGANIIVASNPLLIHIVATAMSAAGLEVRGNLVRLVMTMRGGDRPKNAHEEFSNVSVMPRSMFEPWLLLRHPLEGRVQDTLRKWHTGGFRRPSFDRPFGDVITSHPTPKREREIAPHPSLKPQAFLRAVLAGVLPMGRGTILDPFVGSGSTLAAANALGLESIGIERDAHYVGMARKAIPKLAALAVKKIDPVCA
jgi:site-specific DNA-methyltransferase (adenine-specific)